MTDEIELTADEPPTGRFACLAEGDLDTDEGKARSAARVINGILREFNDWHTDLEEASEALAHSAPTSQRAAVAHDRVGLALQVCEELVASLCDAEDSLDFHWNGTDDRR